MKISYLFHILLILFFAVCNHDCHPQCLDYLPPFEPSSPLQFCVNYRDYGCCDNRLEERIKWDYEYMARDMNSNVSLKILKDILCLQCHPYAAHVFDAESGTDRHSTFQKSHMRFPGLCRDYCYKLFEEQRDVLLKLAINKDFVQFINSTNATEFCNWAQIGDLNYCYPDLDNTTASKESVQIYHKDQLCVEPISGPHFANALVAVHSNDQSHRLFVGEQRGLVFVILPNGTKIEKPFLNITDKIVNSGVPWDERGFLGLVFHPEYKTNGRFFVYYSAPARGLNRDEFSHSKWYWGTKHRIRISEYTVHPDHPNMADHSSELPLLEIDQPEPNHNGGMLLFGTDGYLYVFVGDGGGSGDQHGIHGNGLLMLTMLGKVLRIDVNVEHKIYGIPKDNPFVNFRNVKDEIYALGIRNTWRCSVDLKGSGRMFCGDVGQNRFEEINIIKKGRNYGWRAYEGFSCFDKDLCRRELKNLEFPILAYPHSVGRSIVGGYVYRGCQNPNMYGKYFFADTMNGKIFSAEENPGTGKWDYREIKIGDEKFCNNGFSSVYHKAILSFGESESGEIYLLSTPNPHPDFEGSVLFRLVDPLRRNDPKQCVTRVIEAKPIKTIKRRAIFEKYQQEKDKVMKSGEGDGKAKCRDSGSFCKHYRPTKRRKKPLLSCLKTKHLSKRYCPVTCNFCPK